jgi:uncharacterized protein YjiS (DUF1127 family)
VDKRSLSEALASLEPEFKLAAADFPMSRLRTSVAAACRAVLEWERRCRSRQELRSLKPFEIRDFCLDLMRAEREACKPFWHA